jgi:hypothetical protein
MSETKQIKLAPRIAGRGILWLKLLKGKKRKLSTLQILHPVDDHLVNSLCGVGLSSRADHLMSYDTVDTDVKLVHQIYALVSHAVDLYIRRRAVVGIAPE